MRVCSKNHQMIVYNGDGCPLCTALEAIPSRITQEQKDKLLQYIGELDSGVSKCRGLLARAGIV